MAETTQLKCEICVKMAETTQLKCEICGEVMLARVDNKKSVVYVFCPTMLKDHDIYVICTVQNDIKEYQKNQKGDVNMEVSLLDYGGSVNKKVEYSINEDRSGIYIKEFVVNDKDLYVVNPDLKIEGIVMGDVEFKVLDIIQYKPWNFGKVNKGAGQMGIYKLKDQKDNIYFAIIKDYVAFEGDWRIMLVNIENSEQELKDWLMVDKLGITFMEYIGMG